MMASEYQADELIGFSDDEENEARALGIEMERPRTGNRDLDLITAILEQSSSQDDVTLKQKKVPASSEEERESFLLSRMQEMENELRVLRQKVEGGVTPLQQGTSVSKQSGKSGMNSAAVATVGQMPARVDPAVQRKGVVLNHKERRGSVVTLGRSDGPGNGRRGACKDIKGKVEALGGGVTVRSGDVNGRRGEALGGDVAQGRNIAAQVITKRQEDKQAGIITEKFSGLRIKNPLISSELMKQRMEGRKMIKLKNLSSKKTPESDADDWVTIGVLVDKLPPRDTVKGKKYTIWKLSDLSSQSAVVTLFLFGAAFQSHWKTSLGSVVAILNPQNMSDAQSGAKSSGNYQTAAVSIDNSKKLMLMGISQDYTTCKGVTKGGKRCGNFASVSDGGYCDYHVRRAYDSSRYGPSVTKGTLRDKIFHGRSKTELYYYGGQTFTAAPSTSSKSESAVKGSSSRLFTPGSSEMFKKMLQGQSTGARVLTQYQKGQQKGSGPLKMKPVQKSASELLKEHHSIGSERQSLLGGKHQPLLGRGVVPGSDHVDLFSPPPSLAKRKAIDVVRKKGPISHSPASAAEMVMQKVNESRRFDEDQVTEQPHPKKLKRSSEEREALINAKSSHDWVNKEEELAREEEYFDRLEKKENIETKKGSVTELRITVVCCKKCDYTAESPGDLCIREGHTLSRFKAMKKGFACKGCSQKTFTYDSRFPVTSCQKCGGTNYDPASIYGERKGPVLPTEQLLIRGVEEEFLR